jgi:hypothetical protein
MITDLMKPTGQKLISYLEIAISSQSMKPSQSALMHNFEF